MNVTQIYGIVNDTAADILGSYAPRVKDTTSFVTLGKSIAEQKLTDNFYGALASRISKTVVFIRMYRRNNRRVIEDLQNFGAFVQKIYTELPASVTDPTYTLSNGSNPPTITPVSPYAVSTTINISSLLFGDKGVWSIEVVRPTKQIKEAFLNEATMAAFINGINETIENAVEIYSEGLENLAVSTAIANAIENGCATNVLQVFNQESTGVSITVSKAMGNPDFLASLGEQIKNKMTYFQKPSKKHNPASYMTFTKKENMVLEVLAPVVTAIDTKLKATSYHDELVSLPGMFNEVAYWQSPGTSDSFEDCSTINIKNTQVKNDGATPPVAVAVKQTGILAVLRDDEAVKAYFGDRDTWELPNPRNRSIIHGEQAETGYAVEPHANIHVFYMAD